MNYGGAYFFWALAAACLAVAILATIKDMYPA